MVTTERPHSFERMSSSSDESGHTR
jgi:hypothetical protein